jgi:ubiquinone/menaquinone biosynthesis C-methylase UbiE
MNENPRKHFIKRASRYDNSSGWVNDSKLIKKMLDMSGIKRSFRVLDVAIGTGKIARAFKKKGGYVVGLDICPQMVKKARGFADEIVLSRAEKLPFASNSFDLCVCRQGLQFMDLDKVLSEMRRVLKPSGRVVLCHLTAYNLIDRDLAFLIQRFRNPARKNFFIPQDFKRILKRNKYSGIKSSEYITRESVNKWINNGAISESAKDKIKRAYRGAPEEFKRIHKLRFADGDIFDSMKMVIVSGKK